MGQGSQEQAAGAALTEACGKPFVDRVAKQARELIFPRNIADRVEIVASKLEDAAGIFGAAMLAIEAVEKK